VQFSSSSISRGGTSTFTARVANWLAAGSYPVTVIGTSSGVSPAPTVVVTVVVGGFKLTAGSVSATLARSSIAVIALGTTASSGFPGAVKLTVTGLPAGVTALFTPPTIANPAAGISWLRLTASAAAQEGVRTITIVATSASGLVETAAVSLMVY
jgi:hypothetical protein